MHIYIHIQEKKDKEKENKENHITRQFYINPHLSTPHFFFIPIPSHHHHHYHHHHNDQYCDRSHYPLVCANTYIQTNAHIHIDAERSCRRNNLPASGLIAQVLPVDEAAQAASAGQVIYTNPGTGVKHTYGAGENVQLVGIAATRASQIGLYTVARVLTILPGGRAQLELFKPPGPNDLQVPEGDVGIGADTTVVAFVHPDGSDNIHSLANEASVASDLLLRNNVNAIACDSQPASQQTLGLRFVRRFGTRV